MVGTMCGMYMSLQYCQKMSAIYCLSIFSESRVNLSIPFHTLRLSGDNGAYCPYKPIYSAALCHTKFWHRLCFNLLVTKINPLCGYLLINNTKEYCQIHAICLFFHSSIFSLYLEFKIEIIAVLQKL